MAASVAEGIAEVPAEEPDPLCSNGKLVDVCSKDLSVLQSNTEKLVNGGAEILIPNGYHDEEEKNDTESDIKSENDSTVNNSVSGIPNNVDAVTIAECTGGKEPNLSRDSTPLSDISTLTPEVSRSGTPVSLLEKTEDAKPDKTPPSLPQEKVSRSSEERSMDSTDSGTSIKSSSLGLKHKATPKARKSGPPAKNILPSALGLKSSNSSGENVKLNLPQFNNAITVDSKFLEKISKISSVKYDIKHEKTHTVLPIAKDNAENGEVKQTVKKARASLPINSQPKIKVENSEKSEGNFSDSSLLEKDAFGKIKKRSKKRRKMGAYKLPSEIKKKFGSKKKEGDTNSLKDERDDVDSKNVCSEEKQFINLKLSSPENSSKKSAWDVMKSPKVTPKGKNTLGSTRQKMTPNSVQEKTKAQTSLDSFLNRCEQKSSHTGTQVSGK